MKGSISSAGEGRPLEQLDDYVAVGLEQLNVAIDLFVGDVSYISALSLAVAAESLFERAINKQKGEGALRWVFDSMEYIDPSAPKIDYASFRNCELRERHAAVHGPDKHGAKHKQQPMRAVKDAAEAAIERALTNARVLGLPRSAGDEKFESWFMWKATP